MGTLDGDASALSRKDMLKVRRRVRLSPWRGKIYIAKWPRPRRTTQSQLQQAWVDAFSERARGLKSVRPEMLTTAQELANGTGWYYRDVLESASYGKLLIEENQRRVTTPTARGENSIPVVLTSTVETPLAMDLLLWDNNAFWDPAVPTRLTAKTAGLYLIGANTNWPVVSGSTKRFTRLRVNGTTVICEIDTHQASANPALFALTTIWYFEPSDYVECVVRANTASNQARLNNFFILGITPEILI